MRHLVFAVAGLIVGAFLLRGLGGAAAGVLLGLAASRLYEVSGQVETLTQLVRQLEGRLKRLETAEQRPAAEAEPDREAASTVSAPATSASAAASARPEPPPETTESPREPEALANPADLSSAAGLLALLLWFRKLTSGGVFDETAYTFLLWPWSLLAFFWLNAALARAVHHYAGVEYRLDSLLESSTFQTSLSIFWTVLALSIMQAALRRSSRAAWIAGAVLLGAVVIKLFAVDLSALETTARIISFLVVGILLLVIGYLTPLPPSATNADSKSGGK